MRDDNSSHTIMLIDAHPEPRQLAPGMRIMAWWYDFRLRTGVISRSIVHGHNPMWVVQRQKAMQISAPLPRVRDVRVARSPARLGRAILSPEVRKRARDR
jgi:hypothetical protein